jgi:hypothetical protein
MLSARGTFGGALNRIDVNGETDTPQFRVTVSGNPVPLHVVYHAIVDGIVGMEGNGPIQGTPKSAGVLVAGRDPVSVDATCCRIMKINPLQVGYLRLAMAAESFIAESNIQQIGERIDTVATSFDLIPLFRHFRLETA